MFRALLFFALVTSTCGGESLGPLVKASRFFSVAIQQQLAAIHRGPSLIEFAAKTIVYAHAKAAYFNALREAAPELMNIAIARESRPPELDRMGAAFSVAGEKQERVADEQTVALLQRFAEGPDVKTARAELIARRRLRKNSIENSTGRTSPNQVPVQDQEPNILQGLPRSRG